ncbi:MAG TPA: hypothetical protein VF281_03295, partial [Candidatus Saccharimonadales bacterium]
TGESSGVDQLFRVPKDHVFHKHTERELIQLESEIGAKLFGPLAPGARREFFCLDDTTWIWHEEGLNQQTGRREASTTRYELHKGGILKVQEGSRYTFLEGAELENFAKATRLYYEQTSREIYKRDPQTGQIAA